MAYICKIGSKECDGCGECQEESKSLKCEVCDCDIDLNDKYYSIDENILCEDCGIDYFEENYLFVNEEE